MYLVVRRALDRYGGACEDQFGADTGSRVPLGLFATRGAADAFVQLLTTEVRRTMNPFPMLGGSLSDDVRQRLADCKLPVGCPDDPWREDWTTWWDLCQDLITDGERAAVWAALGATPPYAVVEVEVSEGE